MHRFYSMPLGLTRIEQRAVYMDSKVALNFCSDGVFGTDSQMEKRPPRTILFYKTFIIVILLN